MYLFEKNINLKTRCLYYPGFRREKIKTYEGEITVFKVTQCVSIERDSNQTKTLDLVDFPAITHSLPAQHYSQKARGYWNNDLDRECIFFFF